MGADNSTYIGPYLIVPYKTIKGIDKHYRNASGIKMDSKFDPSTGKENTLVEVPYERKTSPWTEFDEYESLTADELNELEENMFWVPQYTGSKKETSIFLVNTTKDFLKDEEDAYHYDLQTVDIPAELLKFRRKYQKYLDAIKKEYGSIEVKFGVVNYFN